MPGLIGIDFFDSLTGIYAETAKHNPVNNLGNDFLRGTNRRYMRARAARPHISPVSLAIKALLMLLREICITVTAITLFRLPKKSMPISPSMVQTAALPDKITGSMRMMNWSKKCAGNGGGGYKIVKISLS